MGRSCRTLRRSRRWHSEDWPLLQWNWEIAGRMHSPAQTCELVAEQSAELDGDIDVLGRDARRAYTSENRRWRAP